MRKKARQFAALLLAAVLFLGVLPSSYSAAPSVIFTAVNDNFLRNLTPSSMPVKIGGLPYVPYSTFTTKPYPGLISVYNSNNNQLVLYNSNNTLTFDMANAMTYDIQTQYDAVAVRMNGTYYVPAGLVCQAFGFYYSFVPGNLLGPIIRINTEEDTVSDDYLVSKSFSVMRTIYNQYQREYGGEAEVPNPPATGDDPTTANPDPSTPGADPEQPDEPGKTVVYLAFDGDLNDTTGQILDILDANHYTATFFVTGRIREDNVEYLLRAAASGHTIGNNLDGEPGLGPPFADYTEEAAVTTDAVSALTKLRPRVLMVPGGSDQLTQREADSLYDAGYRLWDGTGETRAAWDTATPSSIYAACTALLREAQAKKSNVVLTLRSNEASAQALTSLASYFQANNCEIHAINEAATPINLRRQIG